MPRFFFDVLDGFVAIDNVGRYLPDLEAAKLAAMKVASGFATNTQMIDENGGAMIVVVRDESDNAVLNIRLAFSIEKTLQPA